MELMRGDNPADHFIPGIFRRVLPLDTLLMKTRPMVFDNLSSFFTLPVSLPLNIALLNIFLTYFTNHIFLIITSPWLADLTW